MVEVYGSLYQTATLGSSNCRGVAIWPFLFMFRYSSRGSELCFWGGFGGALSRVRRSCGALGQPGSSLGGLEAIWADGLPTSRDRSVGRSFILLNEALGQSFILLNEALPVGGAELHSPE